MSIGVTTLGYGPEAWDQEFYYPMGIEFMAYGCKLWGWEPPRADFRLGQTQICVNKN